MISNSAWIAPAFFIVSKIEIMSFGVAPSFCKERAILATVELPFFAKRRLSSRPRTIFSSRSKLFPGPGIASSSILIVISPWVITIGETAISTPATIVPVLLDMNKKS